MSAFLARDESNRRRTTYYGVAAGVCLAIIGLASGCAHVIPTLSPVAAGFKPTEIVDPMVQKMDGSQAPVYQQVFAVSERIRLMQQPEVMPPKRTVLVLSGGGTYGAYAAGILYGWTESGSRPTFDVVTGVSTGAIISVFAFLGSEYDDELCRLYTSLKSSDLYRAKSPLRAFLSDSLTDNSPLYQQIERSVTPDVIERIAQGHREGRRLYFGTTDIEGRRPVVWDIGAIAASDKSDRRELICKLMLASAAIPVLFPAIEIPVEVDGKKYVERHVDGGVTQPLFCRLPYVPPEERMETLAEQYYGSDEFLIVAGKLYADPEPVKPKLLSIAGSSLSTFTYAQTRDALVKLYMQTLFTGMNYNLASIPSEFPAPTSATEFNPAEMEKMFAEGRKQIHEGTAWRHTPPGVGSGEELIQRAGTELTYVPQSELDQLNDGFKFKDTDRSSNEGIIQSVFRKMSRPNRKR